MHKTTNRQGRKRKENITAWWNRRRQQINEQSNTFSTFTIVSCSSCLTTGSPRDRRKAGWRSWKYSISSACQHTSCTPVRLASVEASSNSYWTFDMGQHSLLKLLQPCFISRNVPLSSYTRSALTYNDMILCLCRDVLFLTLTSLPVWCEISCASSEGRVHWFLGQ